MRLLPMAMLKDMMSSWVCHLVRATSYATRAVISCCSDVMSAGDQRGAGYLFPLVFTVCNLALHLFEDLFVIPQLRAVTLVGIMYMPPCFDPRAPPCRLP